MSSVEEKRKQRYLFMRKLYDITDADEYKWVSMWGIGQGLNLDRETTQKIVMYLVGENLVAFQALGGTIGITHWGIKEVEDTLVQPDRPTEHFPAINLININSMTNSQISQGNTNTNTESSSNKKDHEETE